ncbi:MAG: hypothetical protein H6587_00345 [Flavobacteriales bacterium]|nr:hypothetical protein [Flavobacteriales bacterium]MCB9362994.1 hypothetical protein [Flavobacteriales bacterium]
MSIYLTIQPTFKKIALLFLIIAITTFDLIAQQDSILGTPIDTLLSIDSTTVSNINTTTTDTTKNSALKGDENSPIFTGFNYSEIELKKGEIISNLFKVYNNTSENIKFSLDILHPGTWVYLTKSDALYEVLPNDTLFIPVILIPDKLINGNTEVIINAFIIDEKNQQIGDNYFSLKTQKKISWNVNVEPSNKFYFKNDETTKRFTYSIENTGNHKQDIFVNYRTLKGNIALLDTNDNKLINPNFTFSLDSWKDTSMTYVASITTDKDRNFKKVSTNSYLPNNNLNYKKYSLFINSSEPKGLELGSYKKGNKVDFIKLPNQAKVRDYGYPYFPLIVELTAQNLLDLNSFLSLNMRGFKQLNEKASLSYFTQLNYNRNYYTNNFLTNSPWYLGYFDDKKTIEVGNVSGNVIGINSYGKGIKASYSYLEKHKTGAFLIKAPGFFGSTRNLSYGLFHTYKHNEYFKITGKAGRQENYSANRSINSFSLQPGFNINKKHYITLLSALTRRENYFLDSSATALGYLVGVNYSSQFLDRNMRLNLGVRYNDKGFSNGSYSRFGLNHRTSYIINPIWNVYLSNRYQNTKAFNSFDNEQIYKQELLSNSLVFNTKSKKGSFQPGIFYDYRDFLSNRLHNRGLSFRYSTFDFLQNFMVSTFFRAGYALPIDVEERKNYFNLQFSSLLRYRVWSLTSRYNYGAFSTSSLQTQIYNGVTPQNVRLSLQNQHQLKNKQFILESNLVYNYGNIFSNHTIGYYPEMFFFTNDGWRFSLRGSYNFNTSYYGNIYVDDPLLTSFDSETDRNYNQNVNIGASIRKEFGIPIPFIKKTSASLEFISFYDINGNGEKENDEPAIENVVLRLGAKEVITNKKGEAAIKNIPMETYDFTVFALDDLQGWFPNTDDSLQIVASNTTYIPFVRGVKVYGDVVLDRQKIAIADTSKPFDLSRIKITAVNGKIYNTLTDINGRFEFYMPNGNYVMTMDETILGDRYTITRNNIPMTLTNKQDGVYISFYIIEKRKKIIIKEFGNSPSSGGN